MTYHNHTIPNHTIPLAGVGAELDMFSSVTSLHGVATEKAPRRAGRHLYGTVTPPDEKCWQKKADPHFMCYSTAWSLGEEEHTPAHGFIAATPLSDIDDAGGPIELDMGMHVVYDTTAGTIKPRPQLRVKIPTTRGTTVLFVRSLWDVKRCIFCLHFWQQLLSFTS